LLSEVLPDKRILVSAGPGGVGKTTVAAALGALAARQGRRTLVVTIDPAPRLADALGVPALGAEPAALSDEACRGLGVPPGALHAARLDTAVAFRRLVERQVEDPQMRRRIFENPIYRQMTSTLTGSQEYAATLALYDFHQSGAYDLVVLDTPPTANALEFLEAPHRIAEAVSSPAVTWFARPPDGGRFSLQRLRSGSALVLQRLGRLVGSAFLDDLGAFLADFRGVLAGFLERAHAIEALLRRPEVGFLLVMAPELPAVDEALFFVERLRAGGLRLEAFVANRVLPAPGLEDEVAVQAQLAAAPLPGWSAAEREAAGHELAAAAAYLARAAHSQRQQLGRLQARAPGVPIVELPLLASEATSPAALRAMGDRLAGAPASG
jgi:anion-transporting  ArsA/GET3 family ATPase